MMGRRCAKRQISILLSFFFTQCQTLVPGLHSPSRGPGEQFRVQDIRSAWRPLGINLKVCVYVAGGGGGGLYLDVHTRLV